MNVNTDVILDFIVEFYIWFIIGGAIILFAIIGFIADKKKIFNKQKKNSKTHDETKENIVHDDIIVDDYEEKTNLIQENSELDLIENQNLNNEIVDEEESLKTSNSDELDNSVNNIGDGFYSESIQSEILNKEDFDDYNEKLDNENSVTYDEIKPDYSDENIQEDFARIDDLVVNQEIKEDKKNVETANILNSSIDEDDEQFSNHASNDIEIIDIKDNNYVDDKTSDEQIVDLNDRNDISLNISYSQLKEIVEEIIAEQEQSDVSKKESNEEKTIESVKQDIKPNLNQEAVENIRQLGDDEDDVWKF